MNTQQYNQLFSFIWNIANDVLVQAFTKGDYKKIILPMMVLRRLDILLEPTHDDVFKQKHKLITDNYPEDVHELFLIQASGYPFIMQKTKCSGFPKRNEARSENKTLHKKYHEP